MEILKITSIALVAVLLIAGAAAGDSMTWTAGGANDNWTTSGNWSGGSDFSDYPGRDSAADTATVPTSLGNPTVDTDIQIASLAVHAGVSAATIIIPDEGATYRTLTLTNANGLSLGSGGVINIDYDAKLVLTGGGVITLDGNIVFTDNGGKTADGVLHIEETTILAGSGDFSTETNALGIISADDAEAVLVLGSGHDISGDFEIQAPLVNNGRLLADGDGDGETITLTMYAKSGNGVYEVTDSDASIIVEIPVNGSPRPSGYQLIVSNGTFQVEEFCVLCGELNMTGGTIDIAPDAMFEISGCD